MFRICSSTTTSMAAAATAIAVVAFLGQPWRLRHLWWLRRLRKLHARCCCRPQLQLLLSLSQASIVVGVPACTLMILLLR